MRVVLLKIIILGCERGVAPFKETPIYNPLPRILRIKHPGSFFNDFFRRPGTSHVDNGLEQPTHTFDWITGWCLVASPGKGLTFSELINAKFKGGEGFFSGTFRRNGQENNAKVAKTRWWITDIQLALSCPFFRVEHTHQKNYRNDQLTPAILAVGKCETLQTF